LLNNLTLFARVLRPLGIEVTMGQILTLVEAAQSVGLQDREDWKAAARAVLVSHREHLSLFDRAFDLFWNSGVLKPPQSLDLGRLLRRILQQSPQPLNLPAAPEEEGSSHNADEVPILEKRQAWSAGEILRHKDFATLSPEEKRAVEALIRHHPWKIEPRRTRRRIHATKGPYLDLRRSLRRSLRHGGELLHLECLKKREKPRRLVVLCDISGSMEAYARIFLQFIYTLGVSTDRLEAFVFATRLTRITRQLELRNVDDALQQAANQIVDWGGGTRIGESLKRFNYEWGRRVLGRGAVVVVLSDGWDRGDVDLLEHETARLKRNSDRLMWLNPLLGSPGYQPLTRGIRRLLPLIDDFMPIHNLKSLEQLRHTLARLRRG
jgi:uncharacterized protein with von Willebrand factor type A (vWA) domain